MNTKEQIQPPPEVFIKPLLELREYYAGLTEEYERLFIEARSQLDHVEALLSRWSFSGKNPQLSQLQAAEETLASPESSSLLFLSSDTDAEFDLDSIESESKELDKLKLDHSSSETIHLVNSHHSHTFPEGNDNFTKGADIPMLPEYHPLTRMEAIKKLLQEYEGTVCHIDFIVRSLYGELESNIFKVVKGRVQSSLTQGRERGYWSAIPNEPGCYTLDLSLLAPNNHNFAQGMKSKKKKPFIPPKSKVVPMLRPFEGQFLIDAITVFLEQNQGRVFNVNEVVAGIYGELDAEQMREVKNKVLNELSRGHRTGRFSRVPNQIGLYTWDARKIRQGGYR
jgi:hypothetical protein